VRRASALLALLLVPVALCWGSPSELTVRPGEPFPNLAFDELVTPDDYQSLGLPSREGSFHLSDIPGELLILEFFNRYCLTCWRQAPQLESLGKLLGPGALAGKVRILSVGAGNNVNELRQFRTEQRVTYPIATDPLFDRYNDLGEPGGTPFTAFLRRRSGTWVLADSHVGFYGDVELLSRARVLLGQRGDQPEAPEEEGGRGGTARQAQDEVRVQAFLSRVAGEAVSLEPVDLPGGHRVYRALGANGAPTGLYARIATRAPVCDLCHRIRFLFAFDDEGVARAFEPVYLTKFGNELWSAEDGAKFSSRLAGRKMDEIAFSPEVDAVTSATMSSALIYDEVRRTAARLRELQQGER
jgi:hypothetical protein